VRKVRLPKAYELVLACGLAHLRRRTARPKRGANLSHASKQQPGLHLYWCEANHALRPGTLMTDTVPRLSSVVIAIAVVFALAFIAYALTWAFVSMALSHTSMMVERFLLSPLPCPRLHCDALQGGWRCDTNATQRWLCPARPSSVGGTLFPESTATRIEAATFRSKGEQPSVF
jgi:hypothetical protein